MSYFYLPFIRVLKHRAASSHCVQCFSDGPGPSVVRLVPSLSCFCYFCNIQSHFLHYYFILFPKIISLVHKYVNCAKLAIHCFLAELVPTHHQSVFLPCSPSSYSVNFWVSLWYFTVTIYWFYPLCYTCEEAWSFKVLGRFVFLLLLRFVVLVCVCVCVVGFCFVLIVLSVDVVFIKSRIGI